MQTNRDKAKANADKIIESFKRWLATPEGSREFCEAMEEAARLGKEFSDASRDINYNSLREPMDI